MEGELKFWALLAVLVTTLGFGVFGCTINMTFQCESTKRVAIHEVADKALVPLIIAKGCM